MRYLTTAEAAQLLGVMPRRVRALIESGKLPAERIGRDWAIKPKDLDRLDRTVGRPRRPGPAKPVSDDVRDPEEHNQNHYERK
ncbi:MAG: helix-turn-helix domain-containing protein [Rubrobacteraceae bacterium]